MKLSEIVLSIIFCILIKKGKEGKDGKEGKEGRKGRLVYRYI